jgi:uncharacterized protein YjdB
MPGTVMAMRDSAPADPLESAGYAAAANARPVSSNVSDTSTPVTLAITRRPARPVAVGSSTSLAAESRDAGGKLLGPQSISWISSDTSIVRVDSSTGLLQALAPGRAQVIAIAGARRDSARIVVRASSPEAAPPPQVGSLSIANHEPLGVGDTAILALTALDTRGKPIRRVEVSWSSSEPTVASVDPNSGRVRAHAPGSTLIIARAGGESAISSLIVRPAAVASVDIAGSRPLKVGDTLELRAEPRDNRGSALTDRQAVWASSNSDVVTVDSSSGRAIARAAGSADITASAEGRSGKVRITVLPKPRTSRTAELAAEAEAGRAPEAGSVDPATERLGAMDQLRAGVEECYEALARKDIARVEWLYRPESKSDREKMKKLGRILQTGEWEAQVGVREDGAQRIGSTKASMEFGFRLAWKDAFGGRLASHPVFRAEFDKSPQGFILSSCRIVGSPRL